VLVVAGAGAAVLGAGFGLVGGGFAMVVEGETGELELAGEAEGGVGFIWIILRVRVGGGGSVTAAEGCGCCCAARRFLPRDAVGAELELSTGSGRAGGGRANMCIELAWEAAMAELRSVCGVDYTHRSLDTEGESRCRCCRGLRDSGQVVFIFKARRYLGIPTAPSAWAPVGLLARMIGR